MVEHTRSRASSLLRLYGHFSRRRRIQLFLILVLMLIGALAEFATIGATIPFLALISDQSGEGRWTSGFRSALDVIGVEPQYDILAAAILFMAIAVGALIVRLVLVWASQRFIFRVGYDLSVAVLTQVLHKPYKFHVENNSSEIIANLNKAQFVVVQMLQPLMQGFTAMCLSLFIIAALLFVNVQLAIVLAVLFSLIYFGMALSIRRKLTRNGRFIAAGQGRRIQVVQEGLGAIRDIILGRTQNVAIGKFAAVDGALRKRQATNMFIAATPRLLVECIGMIIIAVAVLFIAGTPGGLLPLIPTLGAFALGAQRLMPLAEQAYRGWAGAISSRQLLDDVLAQIPDNLHSFSVPDHPGMDFRETITFEKVSFAYDPAQPILTDVSFTVRKNEMIGIVGATGSGKSTLIDLVLGLLQPVDGVIRIDGTALSSANMAGWQDNISHVPQTIYLSDATIAENIAFNVPLDRIDMARVEDAARQADIHDAIASWPGAYLSVVGERGVRLSGGQRQRIGIARALYSRANVLVLDEATNALDAATEANIMQSINNLQSNKTILIVAHRSSALTGCDRVIDLSALNRAAA